MQVHPARAPVGDALGQQRADPALVDLPHVHAVEPVRPDARAFTGSIERAPKIWMLPAATAGPSPRIGASTGSPAIAASAIPCMFPVGLVSGVL